MTHCCQEPCQLTLTISQGREHSCPNRYEKMAPACCHLKCSQLEVSELPPQELHLQVHVQACAQSPYSCSTSPKPVRMVPAHSTLSCNIVTPLYTLCCPDTTGITGTLLRAVGICALSSQVLLTPRMGNPSMAHCSGSQPTQTSSPFLVHGPHGWQISDRRDTNISASSVP